METETTARIMRTDAYIASLNIPHFNCDREDKEQVKMHMLCSMLCCPKQINEDETISAENADLNLRQVSRLWLSLYTVGRIATDYDRVEADRIAKNMERVFQLPLFEKLVQMDGNAKFRAVPPEQILPLYERIIRGGQWLRLRKGEHKARKDRECNTPEAVYKAKVACNFLLKLIAKERSHQKAHVVDWQSVQNRYAEMFANEHSEDRKLMDYFEEYGLEFSQPHLNSELIKSWTGRSQITKALSLPLFSKIYWETDENTGFLRVGFGSDIELYSDEELREALNAMRVAAEEKQRIANNAVEQERYSKVFTPTEVQRHTPVEQRPIKDFTDVPAVTTASSPFANFGRHSSGVVTRKIRKHISMNEAQYIPSSNNVEESSDSFSDSDDEGPKGVYSDDEEIENNLPAVSKKESTLSTGFQPTGFAVPKPEPSLVKPKPVPVAVKPYYAGRQEEIRVDATVEPFQNRWESEDDQGQARARINIPRSNHPPTNGMPMSNPAQPHPSESFDSASRHVSAFQSCKQPGRSDKNDEGAKISHPEQVISTNKDNRRSNIDQRALYDQRENSHEKHERANNADFGQNDRFNSQDSHYAPVDRRSHPTDLPDSNSQSRMRSPEDGFSSSRRESVFARSSDRSNLSTDRQNERPESRQRFYNGFKSNNVDSRFHGASESAFSRTVDESSFRPRSVLRQTSMQSLASSRSLINEGYDSRNNNTFQNEFGRKASTVPKYSEWDDDHHDEERRGFRSSENRQPSNHFSEEGHGRPKADFPTPPRDAYHVPESTSARSEHDRLDDFRNRSRQNYRNEPSHDHRDRDRTLSASHPEPLTADQAARLRMIRDYTFLHRNVKELGFRTIDKISSILPPDDSINYLQLVQEHIPEIETAPFRDTNGQIDIAMRERTVRVINESLANVKNMDSKRSKSVNSGQNGHAL